MSDSKADTRLQVSYLTLRRTVGVLGISLPILLLLGSLLTGAALQGSISDYYSTGMRNVFVGVLFAVGWFLFSYRGYERQDDLVGDLACLFALGVALCPVTSESAPIRGLHLLSAALLFLVLAYFSLCLFRKTDEKRGRTPQKKMRDKVYLVCGWLMLASIGSIAVYYWKGEGTDVARLKPVFWLESIALWAFGVSWFVKGETLLRDPK